MAGWRASPASPLSRHSASNNHSASRLLNQQALHSECHAGGESPACRVDVRLATRTLQNCCVRSGSRRSYTRHWSPSCCNTRMCSEDATRAADASQPSQRFHTVPGDRYPNALSNCRRAFQVGQRWLAVVDTKLFQCCVEINRTRLDVRSEENT